MILDHLKWVIWVPWRFFDGTFLGTAVLNTRYRSKTTTVLGRYLKVPCGYRVETAVPELHSGTVQVPSYRVPR